MNNDMAAALAWAWDEGHQAGAEGAAKSANPYRDGFGEQIESD